MKARIENDKWSWMGTFEVEHQHDIFVSLEQDILDRATEKTKVRYESENGALGWNEILNQEILLLKAELMTSIVLE